MKTNSTNPLQTCSQGLKAQFPKNEALWQQWIQAIPHENLNPAPLAVICSLHFEETDFKTYMNKSGL